MDKYLQQHYTGTYRVLPHLDLDTNEIPRDHNGDWDNSYADFYIKCAYGIEIRHGVGSEMICYIPTKQRGMNILKQIYTDKIDKVLPNEETAENKKYLENLCDKLISTNTLIDAEVLDYEVYFIFNTKIMDYIVGLVKPSTSGASISPFSVKNLPKVKYNIPQDDLEKYKESIKNFPTRKMERNGEHYDIVDGMIIKKANSDFDEIIKKKLKLKKLDKSGYKTKEYIHSIGMWNEYCEFLRNFKY